MVEILDSYDKALMLLLNYDGGAWADGFWFGYSGKWIWVGVYLCILLQFYKSCRQQPRKWLALLWLVLSAALLITFCDQISSGLIKPLAMRLRPSHSPEIRHLLHYVNDYHGGRYGFVSSHAANSIGLVVWLCLLFRSKVLSFTMVLWSLLTCYSRIYLGVHYPGDILGGLCVGIFSAFLINFLYRRFVPASQQLPAGGGEPWLIVCAVALTVVSLGVI